MTYWLLLCWHISYSISVITASFGHNILVITVLAYQLQHISHHSILENEHVHHYANVHARASAYVHEHTNAHDLGGHGLDSYVHPSTGAERPFEWVILVIKLISY